ncbi:MAG: carbon-nitrogen hydrolase family protein [Moorellales bacterium]
MKLALVQLARARTAEENRARLLRLVEEAREADLVLLSENWLGPFPVPLEYYLAALSEVAERLRPGSLLAGGAQYVRDGDELYSRGAFVCPSDGVLAWYEKRFPSQPVGERGHLTPGNKSGPVRWREWTVGALVCVDLFYPELARELALAGCDILLNPVSVPRERRSLWQALGLARAAENTVYVAVANNTASAYADGREIAGGSFVALPDGRLAAVAGREETVLQVELDRQKILRVRERWPYLEDARRLADKGN